VSIGLLIGLLVVLVLALLWRQNQNRARAAREREERRARADQVIARALRGEDRSARHTRGGPGFGGWPEGDPDADRPAPVPAAEVESVDIDILLGDEPTAVAERARAQLARPTTLLSGLSGGTTAIRKPDTQAPPALSVLDGRIDVPLDALVVAWFSARGYVALPAPETAQPISLLLTHRDDNDRSYAFVFDRGRLQSKRAATLLEKAHALGMHRLLVAAEHGAEASVGSARLRDVLVMDWTTVDHELKKIDFSVAAKIVAIARSRRGGSEAS
jgi:hypothetical protein